MVAVAADLMGAALQGAQVIGGGVERLCQLL
jgi:hypothetical protein